MINHQFNGVTTDFDKHRQTSNTISEQTKAFLASGGKVKQIKQGLTAIDYNKPKPSTATNPGRKKGISTKRAQRGVKKSHAAKPGGY